VQCNLLKDFDRARASYEQALAANPNESLAWLFQGTLLAFQDEGEQAMASSQRALELSPLDPMRYFYESLSATAALSARQWGLAIERATHSLRLNYSHTSTLRVLTIANVQIGAMDEARRWGKRLLEQEGDLTIAEYRLRSPSTGFKTGEIWCESLRAAGVPAA
jgi:adenylate cyclase